MLLYLQNIIQLILSPGKGWEDIASSTHDTHALVTKALYPLIAVAALSGFIQYIYYPDIYLPSLIVKALVVFVSLFATYYFALSMSKSFLYKFCETEPSEFKYTTVMAYSVCLLSISTVICNAMPVKLGLKYLLPLAVGLIMWKSDALLKVRNEMDFGFFFFCLFTTIIPPTLIQSLFDIIL